MLTFRECRFGKGAQRKGMLLTKAYNRKTGLCASFNLSSLIPILCTNQRGEGEKKASQERPLPHGRAAFIVFSSMPHSCWLEFLAPGQHSLCRPQWCFSEGNQNQTLWRGCIKHRCLHAGLSRASSRLFCLGRGVRHAGFPNVHGA